LAHRRYAVTVLNFACDPRGLNDLGQVTGDYFIDRGAANAIVHPFLWQNGAMTDLGVLGSDQSIVYRFDSFAASVNNAGQVAGYSPVIGETFTRAYVWQNGVMHEIGTLGGESNFANAINNAGQVVGESFTGDPKAPSTLHAFVYDTATGVMKDIDTLGASYSDAFAINDRGQIAGEVFPITVDGGTRAFLYDNGAMVNLGVLPGGNPNAFALSYARGINNLGQVVGSSTVGLVDPFNESLYHGFLYASGAMTDLGTLPGGTMSDAADINDLGQIVGSADTLDASGNLVTHAYLFEDGVMTDLNDLIDPSLGVLLAYATGINEKGQIVGGSGNRNGQGFGFLLTPFAMTAPEPGALALFGASLLPALCLTARRRRGPRR
jgi:probable HAF family extracellular repeat protein